MARPSTPGGYVSPRALVEEGVVLGDGVAIYGEVVLRAGSIVDSGATIGYPAASAVRRVAAESGAATGLHELLDAAAELRTEIGPGAFIRRGAVLYEGLSAGEGLDCAHEVIVREGCTLDSHVELGPLTYLKRDCRVGPHSRIASEICDRTVVGAHCTVYGRTIHRFLVGVSGEVEPAPTLEDGVVVGREACVIGDIVIGKLSLVGAGSVVTASVPSYSVVTGNPSRFLRTRERMEAPALFDLVEGLRHDGGRPE